MQSLGRQVRRESFVSEVLVVRERGNAPIDPQPDPPPGVKTTCVCPYFIDTGMFDGVRTKWPWIMPILKPDYAADKIVLAIRTNQEILMMPRFLYIAMALKPLLPTSIADELAVWIGAR